MSEANAIADFFANNPGTTLIMLGADQGHAFGRLKYNGRCKLTGMQMMAGEKYRRVKIHCHTGHTFEGFVSTHVMQALDFRELGNICTDAGYQTVQGSRTSKGTAHEALAATPVGSELTLFKQMSDNSFRGSTYRREASGWSCKRRGGIGGRDMMSDKQIASRVARSSKKVLYRLQAAGQI